MYFSLFFVYGFYVLLVEMLKFIFMEVHDLLFAVFLKESIIFFENIVILFEIGIKIQWIGVRHLAYRLG